ncbi:hypothetical protein ISCGN_024505 [Ixodes scapularis]
MLGVFGVVLSESATKHSFPTIKRLVISWEHGFLPTLYHFCRHSSMLPVGAPGLRNTIKTKFKNSITCKSFFFFFSHAALGELLQPCPSVCWANFEANQRP